MTHASRSRAASLAQNMAVTSRGAARNDTRLDALSVAAQTSDPVQKAQQLQQMADMSPVVQRRIKITNDERRFKTPYGKTTSDLIAEIKASGTDLKQGWIREVRELAKDQTTHNYPTKTDLIDKLAQLYPPRTKGGPYDRPSFSTRAYRLAKIVASLGYNRNMLDISLGDNDLALPHRMSFRDIRESTRAFADGPETDDDLTRWTDRLIVATEERMADSKGKFAALKAQSSTTLRKTGMSPVLKQSDNYKADAKGSVTDAQDARTNLIKKANGKGDTSAAIKSFLKAFNEIHGNIPDVGPHVATNIVASSRAHLNSVEIDTSKTNRGRPHNRTGRLNKRALSPGSRAVRDMSPHRIGDGIATDNSGKYLLGTKGDRLDIFDFDAETQTRFGLIGLSKTSATAKSQNADSESRKRKGQFDPRKNPAPTKKRWIGTDDDST